MVIFAHPQQDPSSTVLNILQLLKAFVRDPGEECIAVVQPGGDKSVDKLFRVCRSECGTEFGDVPEVKEGGLAEMFDVSLKGQMRVHFNTQVSG